jgi:AbrB family looped-hinge helix DNA binding protein
MPTATITSKGQITIPIELRKALGLDFGDKIDFFEVAKGEFRMSPRTASIRDLEGIIPKLDYVPTLEQLDEDILDAAVEDYMAGMGNAVSDSEKEEAA